MHGIRVCGEVWEAGWWVDHSNAHYCRTRSAGEKCHNTLEGEIGRPNDGGRAEGNEDERNQLVEVVSRPTPALFEELPRV